MPRGYVARVCLLLLTCALPVLAQDASQRVGLPIDWSSSHILHTQRLDAKFESLMQQDPRVLYNWIRHNSDAMQPGLKHRLPAGFPRFRPKVSRPRLSVDWSFPLGPSGTVSINMYPAKYNFDAGSTAVGNCTTNLDYIVLGLNGPGSSTQPSIVRLTNLYGGSGTTTCGYTNPILLSAYFYSGSKINTSPSISFDGKKVAFLETTSTNTSIFHVLSWSDPTPMAISAIGESSSTVTVTTSAAHGLAAGNIVKIAGISVNGYNGTYAIASVPTTTTFTYTALQTGLGAPTGSPLGQVLATGDTGSFNWSGFNYAAVAPPSANDFKSTASIGPVTYSSPFVLYGSGGDQAYFGDDNGVLYHTNCVFFCSGASVPVDSVTLASGVTLGPPVVDANTNKLFVGGSDGNLYAVDLTACNPLSACASTIKATCTVGGAACASSAIQVLTVGSNAANGGVYDGPAVDPANGLVYAFTGNTGGNAVGIAQTNETFNLATATAGQYNPEITVGKSNFRVFDGAFDNTYYTTPGSGHIAMCVPGNSGAPVFAVVSFAAVGSTPLISTVTTTNIPGNSSLSGCTGVTEFSAAADYFFFGQTNVNTNKCPSSGTANGAPTGCATMYTLSGGVPTPTTPITAFEEGGTSGVIIDSISGGNMYFATLGATSNTATTNLPLACPNPSNPAPNSGTAMYCAVKLTQSGLQ